MTQGMWAASSNCNQQSKNKTKNQTKPKPGSSVLQPQETDPPWNLQEATSLAKTLTSVQ